MLVLTVTAVAALIATVLVILGTVASLRPQLKEALKKSREDAYLAGEAIGALRAIVYDPNMPSEAVTGASLVLEKLEARRMKELGE